MQFTVGGMKGSVDDEMTPSKENDPNADRQRVNGTTYSRIFSLRKLGDKLRQYAQVNKGRSSKSPLVYSLSTEQCAIDAGGVIVLFDNIWRGRGVRTSPGQLDCVDDW